jgi:hypothetical protein
VHLNLNFYVAVLSSFILLLSSAGTDVQSLNNIHWRSNKKAWMTRELFDEWMNKIFAPSVAAWLEKERLPKKALLLLDNCSAHSPNNAVGKNQGLTDENNTWITVSSFLFYFYVILFVFSGTDRKMTSYCTIFFVFHFSRSSFSRRTPPLSFNRWTRR